MPATQFVIKPDSSDTAGCNTLTFANICKFCALSFIFMPLVIYAAWHVFYFAMSFAYTFLSVFLWDNFVKHTMIVFDIIFACVYVYCLFDAYCTIFISPKLHRDKKFLLFRI
jgi:hypothetical protein